MAAKAMRTAIDIYEEYQTMPQLQMHQLRVAAVGKTLCDALTDTVDTRSVVLAGLFHDMGNIVKSDFDVFPQFVEPLGRAHWEKVKGEYSAKYGRSSHRANVAIAGEIGLPPQVVALIDGLSFWNLSEILSSGSLEQKIVEYCDMRVGPHGVLSLQDRLDDSEVRYRHRYASPEEAHAAYKQLSVSARGIEVYVCEKARISPEQISDDSIRLLIEELKHFQVG